MSRLESAPGARQQVPGVAVTRPQRLTLAVLRWTLAVHLVLVAAQPTLAGLFLSGDVDAIAVHGTVATLVTTLGMLVTIVAVGYALLGARWWPALVSLAMFTAEGVQISLGHSRDLGLHIPLGVAITVCAALLTAWSWTAAATRVRRPLWRLFR